MWREMFAKDKMFCDEMTVKDYRKNIDKFVAFYRTNWKLIARKFYHQPIDIKIEDIHEDELFEDRCWEEFDMEWDKNPL